MKQTSSREDRQLNRLLFPAYHGEMKMLVYIAMAVAYWTFAVACVAILAPETSRDWKDVAFVIGLAVFWPVAATLVIPALVYQAAVASTSRIRADLKNRGVLREFEGWLRERKKDEE